MAQVSWYLAPAALCAIASLLSAPPQRVFVRDDCSRNPHDGCNHYAGPGVDALHDLAAREWQRISGAAVWDHARAAAFLDSGSSEVLAALFGDPNNLDFAFPERTGQRAAIAAEIHAALGQRKAA